MNGYKHKTTCIMLSESNDNSLTFRTKYKNESLHKKSDSKFEKEIKEPVHYWIILPPVIAILCYLNGLPGDFVHDDLFAIVRNGDVTGKTPLLTLFRNDFWGKAITDPLSHKSYRPLTVLTFRLTYSLVGPVAFYFHVVNVLLHACVTYMLTGVCHEHFRLNRTCSQMVGLLFAVHPIHTESVTGIVGRADLLACLFFLISFHCYNRSLDLRWNCQFPVIKDRAMFIASMTSAAAAMFSKETGITVLAVSIVFDCLVLCRAGLLRMLQLRHISAESRPLQQRCLCVLLTTVSLLTFRLWVMGGTLPIFLVEDNPASFSPSIVTRVLSYNFVWVYNVWLLIAPVNLCYDWQLGSIPLVETISDVRNLATISFYIIMSCSTFRIVKNSQTKCCQPDILLLSIVFIVIPFFPASNLFFRVGFVLAERVLYAPSMGFCLGVGVGVYHLSTTWSRWKPAILAMFYFVLLMHAGKTWKQNQVWLTRESLFRSGIQAHPHNAKVHYNFGNFLKDNGQHEEAVHHYRRAISLHHDYASSHNNIGTLLLNETEREYHFREALHICPTHPGAHVNLGNILFQRGEERTGIELLRRALEIEPNNVEGLASLGSAMMETGDLTQAEQLFKVALDIRPDYIEVYTYYGSLLHKMGKHKKSAEYYRKAFSLDPQQSGALAYAAYAYREMGDVEMAEDLFKKSLSVRKEPGVMEQLAILYYNSGRTQETLQLYEEIQRLVPNATKTMIRYSNILGSIDQLNRALTILHAVLDMSPEDVEALRTIAGIYSEQGKYSLSKGYCGTAIRLAEAAGNQALLLHLYNDQGNYCKALDLLDEAAVNYKAVLQIDRNHVDAHANLGALLHTAGNIDQAKKHYDHALRLDPENTLVRRNIEKLTRLRRQKKLGLA